jgi:hypothetical protein
VAGGAGVVVVVLLLLLLLVLVCGSRFPNIVAQNTAGVRARHGLFRLAPPP